MDLALNTTSGDLDLKQGDLYVVKDQDAVRQYIWQKLRMFLGEWFLDETEGVPYLDAIFVKNPNPVLINSVFKQKILETPGVQELLEFSLDLVASTRTLTISFKCRTKDGVIDFSQKVVV